MDPDACLTRLLESNELSEVVQAAADLLHWCLSGGFIPTSEAYQREQIQLALARCADLLEDD